VKTSGASCIVVAAGRGDRLGAGQPKAFVPVGGRTAVEHVVHTVATQTSIARLVIVVPGDQIDATRRLLDTGGFTRLNAQTSVTVVAGGTTRQESVAAGMAALHDSEDDSEDIVLVHDAARCLTPGDVFERVIAAIRDGHDAAVPVLPVVDTIKQVSDDTVIATVDRSNLRVVQTPQGFRRAALLAAHEAAVRSGGDAATDDAGLVERMGMRVHLVDGDDRALKITRPFDLTVADALAAALASSEETSP